MLSDDHEETHAMTFAEFRRDTVPVQLPNGAIVKVEVAQTGREDVAFEVKSFKGVTDAIEGIAEAVTASLQNVSPNKASVKFGLEIEIEQGSLVAAIVKGTGKANLEITLEWERSDQVEP
jgi:hypothetical protein